MKKIASPLIARTVLTALLGAGSLFISSQSGFSAAPTWVTWEVSSGGNGHQYLAVPGFGGLTWNAADTLAQQQGGYLATVTSAAENNFVFGLVNSSQFFTGANGSGPALGGILPPGNANGQYAWVTGEAWNYTNWYPTSPDGFNLDQTKLHYWSEIGSTPAATWGDIGANDTNIGGYVAERLVVPEPGSLSLLAGGAVVLMAFKKRNVKTA